MKASGNPNIFGKSEGSFSRIRNSVGDKKQRQGVKMSYG
jgi:hypothetical protein